MFNRQTKSTMAISNSYKLFFQLCLISHKRTLIRNVVSVSPDNPQTTNSFHLKYFQQNNKNLQSLWIIINWIPTKRDKSICEHFLPQMSRRYQRGCIFMSVSFNLCVCCVCCFFCKHLTACFTEIAFTEKNMTGIWIHGPNTQRGRYYRRSQARVLKRPRFPLDPVNHHTHAHTLKPTCFFCHWLDSSCTKSANIGYRIWRQRRVVTAFRPFVIDCGIFFFRYYSNSQLLTLYCFAHSLPSSVIISYSL